MPLVEALGQKVCCGTGAPVGVRQVRANAEGTGGVGGHAEDGDAGGAVLCYLALDCHAPGQRNYHQPAQPCRRLPGCAHHLEGITLLL